MISLRKETGLLVANITVSLPADGAGHLAMTEVIREKIMIVMRRGTTEVGETTVLSHAD
jgi:hypothetical protein